MRSTSWLPLFLSLACGPIPSDSTGGTTSNETTTFCALLRVVETRCASGGGGHDSTDVSLETRVENRASCAGLGGQTQVVADSQRECVITTRFELSSLNEHGPFAATCAEYEAWRTGKLECLAPTTDGLGHPLTCEHGRILCGSTPFAEFLHAPPPPEQCRGRTVVMEHPSCENGGVVTQSVTVRTCSASCTQAGRVATCDGPGGGADAGSTTPPDAGSPPAPPFRP